MVHVKSLVAEQPVVNNSLLGTYTNFVNLLDYCATAVPVGFMRCGVPWGVSLFASAFEDVKLLGFAHALHCDCLFPVGATGHEPVSTTTAATPAVPGTVEVVVCGAHLHDQPLHWQLTERGGRLLQCTTSAPTCQLYALSDGRRPAMVRNEATGVPIEVGVWAVPQASCGSFVAAIPAPLGTGKVE